DKINALKQKLNSLEQELERELRTLSKRENSVKQESDRMVVTKKQRVQLHTEDRIKGSKRKLQETCDHEFGRKKRIKS
ncbi:1593_t:CDS:1, partial [Paraglomus occultum]